LIGVARYDMVDGDRGDEYVAAWTRRTAARSEAVRNAHADTAPDAETAPTNEVMP
jgi:hypothetical protein